MISRRKFVSLSGVGALVAVVVGCTSNRRARNVKPLRIEVEPSPEVELPPPSVRWDGNVLRVAGVIRREASFDGTVAGHLHVDLVSSGGELLDQVLLQWTPPDIPRDGARQSSYRMSYVPQSLPPGTLIRVAVVDDEQEHSFPGPEASGGRAGGTSRTGARTGTPSPLGKPRTGRAPMPRQPRQRSSTPRTPGGSRGRR